jgi:anti-anti-sigma regulatory factor
MDRWYALRSVGTMLPGDHAWLSYSCREEQEHVIGAFVRDGLAASDKVIYITDGDPLAGLRQRYALELDRYLRTGQLAVLSPAAVFDPARMHDALAENHRFRGVRVASDMTWAIRQRTGRDRVLDCEERLDAAIAPSTTAMAICQVDERSCTPDELTVLKERHEVLVGADPEFDDGVLTITRTFRPRGLRLVGELDGARHCWFEEALRSVLKEGGEVHLDMAGLRFIDLGALSLMAGAAMHLGGSARLIIDRPSPDVAEVVKLVGGLMLPWLEIRDDEEP